MESLLWVSDCGFNIQKSCTLWQVSLSFLNQCLGLDPNHDPIDEGSSRQAYPIAMPLQTITNQVLSPNNVLSRNFDDLMQLVRLGEPHNAIALRGNRGPTWGMPCRTICRAPGRSLAKEVRCRFPAAPVPWPGRPCFLFHDLGCGGGFALSDLIYPTNPTMHVPTELCGWSHGRSTRIKLARK